MLSGNTCSGSVSCLFILVVVFFSAVQKLIRLLQSHLFVLLLFPCLRRYIQTISWRPIQCTAYGFFKGFYGFSFSKYFFWVYFHIRQGKVVQSDSLAWKLSSFPNTIYWQGYLFPTVCSSFLFLWIDYICGFILGFSVLFHWPLCLFLCQYHIVLVTRVLQYSLKSMTMTLLALFFFFKTVLAIWGLCISYLFQFCKIAIDVLVDLHWLCTLPSVAGWFQ